VAFRSSVSKTSYIILIVLLCHAVKVNLRWHGNIVDLYPPLCLIGISVVKPLVAVIKWKTSNTTRSELNNNKLQVLKWVQNPLRPTLHIQLSSMSKWSPFRHLFNAGIIDATIRLWNTSSSKIIQESERFFYWKFGIVLNVWYVSKDSLCLYSRKLKRKFKMVW
jgi:hypothetical protein